MSTVPLPPQLPGMAPDQVHWPHVKVLMQAYRRMETRGGAVAAAAGRRADNKNTLRKFFLIYGLNGLFIGMLALGRMPVYLFSTLALSYSALMLGLLITSEAGTLFFNPDERDVLGHLPISPRSYYTARCLNLVFYVGLLLLPLNFFPMLTGIMARGAAWTFPLAHLVSTFALGLFVSGLVLIFYGILMRYIRKDSLQSVITVSQVALTFLFIASYQFLPRVMGNWRNWQVPDWMVFYPPSWFASLAEVLQGRWTTSHLSLAAMAMAATTATMFTALRRFAGAYSSTLQEMTEQEGGRTQPTEIVENQLVPAAKRMSVRRGKFIPLMARLMLVTAPEQRASFDLALLNMARDHELKRRLYPSLAWLFGMPFIGVITGQASDPWVPGHGNSLFSYLVAFTAATQALTTLELLLYSRSWEASYIFSVTPLRRLDLFYGGIRKAVTAVILLPTIVGITVLLSVLWKNPTHALLHMAPWAMLSLPAGLLPFMRKAYIPLSQPVRQSHQAATNMLVMFGSMLFLGLIAAGQYWCTQLGYYGHFLLGVAVLSFVLFALARFTLRRRASRVLQYD